MTFLVSKPKCQSQECDIFGFETGFETKMSFSGNQMVIQWNTNESGKTLCYADPVYCSQPINFGLGGFIRVCEYIFPIRISYLDLHEEYDEHLMCGLLKQPMHGTRDAAQRWET